ncbi:MAG: AMP-binding protein [Gemmatimonadota bacterium]
MDFLLRAARLTPEAPAVFGLPDPEGGETPIWTYHELDQWADTVARALVVAGVGPGERVAMRLPPCPETVVLLHAVARAGAVLVPMNAGWTEAEVARALQAVGRPALFVSTMGEVVEWDGEGPAHPLEDLERLPQPRLSGPAVLVLTSGTTGAPRPIPLSHRNLAASAEAAILRLDLAPEDCWLTSLSPGHVGGIALLHRAAVVGCSVLTRPRFDALEAAELMDAGRVTHASLVPIMLQRLIEVRGKRPPPPSLRCLLIGGAEIRESLLTRALTLGYPIALTYGLTEATSQVATAPPEVVRKKPGTVGRPLDSLELKIEGAGEDGTGEILVRGPTVVKGLARGPSKGKGVRAASVFVDSDGWLHTGDLGRLDGEGDLWVVGRLSDRIVTGGVTVEPAEVEVVLHRHPGVADVAVAGAPDKEWGERVVAVVVPADPAAPPTLPDLLDFSRGRLASAKRPRELRLVESLPRNPNGKLDRKRLLSSPPAAGP